MNRRPSDRSAFEADSANIAELRERLREAEETLEAIRNGDVDAVVVGGPSGQQVYTLENADRPYRVLIEQMQEGAVTLSEDGTVLYCNQRLATLTGMRRETLIGHAIDPFIAEDERHAFRRLLAHGHDAGRSDEFTLIAVNGTAVPVNVSIADLIAEEHMPRVICGVITDLTHSRKRSHELAGANTRLASEIDERRRAEDSLQLALDAADMGNWDFDLVTDVARRSPRYNQIFGHSASSKNWSLQVALKQFLDEDRAAVSEAFAQAQKTGWIDFEKRIVRENDHAIRWVQIKGLTYYRDSKPIRIAGVVSDVTERRLIDEQLRQAQKMEAIGQLTGGIAHDFNNLLMVIAGSLDLLEDRVSGDQKSVRYLGTARHGVERGAKLNQQLLAFARRQDLRVEPVCIDDLIATFEILLDRAIGETVTVRIQPAPEMWFCRTDPHQLETAILNLAINARDAMPQGGTLTLSTATKTLNDHAAAMYGATPGDYVVVAIADTGVGMTPDIASKVFEPFFTTKEVGKGTGLGLSQVYGFAKQSGGFVTIESELQHGTTVFIHLPRTSQPSRSTDTARAQAEVKGKGTILVVEDDDDVRTVAGNMLRELGYSVLEVDRARSALAIVERGDAIDLIFTDVIMPGDLNGIDLIRELKARHADIPILLTSGYTAQRLVADDMDEGLQILRKPYNRVDLSVAVESAMNT